MAANNNNCSNSNINKSPIKELPKPLAAAEASAVATAPPHLQSSLSPITPIDSKPTPPPNDASSLAPAASTTVSRVSPAPPSAGPADIIHIPSYSRWFSREDIHECEIRHLPEFFYGKSPSKSPRVYKYFRNTIIRRYRENPSRKITFTEVRKTIIGDVGSIRRVFDFLETWGLINYSGSSNSKPQSKWEDKDSTKSKVVASAAVGDSVGTSPELGIPKKRLCSGCKSVCTIACFACDKYDLSLCARCYVRGNYRVGLSTADFKRVEISEEVKTDWTEKETLHLLEAIMHYGDNWKKVAEHVGGRSEKDCVACFIKIPFSEQFLGHPDSAEVDSNFTEVKGLSDSASSPAKKIRLTPLADASNPITAQAAFLSALVGVDVAQAAAQAAVEALHEVNHITSEENLGSLNDCTRQQESALVSGSSKHSSVEGAHVEAQLELEKEQQDLERSISTIAEVLAKEIQEKIVHIEELDLHREREWQRLLQIKNQLFNDQLTLLFHKTAAARSGESMEERARTEG